MTAATDRLSTGRDPGTETDPGAEAGRLPGEREVLDRASGENFSVASIVLGRTTRAHLLAIYGFARLVDQIGDATAGDRLDRLDRLQEDLDRVYGGEPEHPLLRRLVPTVRALDLPRGPFLRLIEANRRDQVLVAYETFDDLLGYCDLSANPVGELVLHVFGAATPERIELSDHVCTALQLAEHWQDVAEDFHNGRVYLPREDLDRFGVAAGELGGAETGDRLRALLAYEVGRAHELLDAGSGLIGTLRGRARIAVAGYVGGGRSALDAIVASGFDVLGGVPAAGATRRARATLQAYRRGS